MARSWIPLWTACCSLLACSAVGDLPLWVPVFVIGRDAYLALGGLILQHFRRRPIDVVYIGKAATALLMFGFCDLLLGVPVLPAFGLVDVTWLPLLNAQGAPLGMLLVYAGVLCSVAAAVLYTVQGVRVLRSSKRDEGARA